MVTIFASWAAPRRKSVVSSAGAVWRCLKTWSNRWRQRQDLRELDARMLRDVGLSRLDVEIECNKPFWRV